MNWFSLKTEIFHLKPLLQIKEQSLFVTGVGAEQTCFLTLEKVLANQFDNHFFITQPSSDTTFLIPNPDTTNISDL